MKLFFAVILLSLAINLILGTEAINNVQGSGSFFCTAKVLNLSEMEICSKKYGFSIVKLLLSIPAIAFIINLFSGKLADTFLKSLGVGVLWILVSESLIRLLKIPVLYSWELSSLHYEAFTIVSGLKFIVVLMLLTAIISGMLGYIVGQLIFWLLHHLRSSSCN